MGVCDIITIGNPNDTPASEIVGDNVSVDVQEDEEVYSVTEKDLNAHAYNVMVRTLHTCATKDEMMIVGYALDEFINEITGGNEDD